MKYLAAGAGVLGIAAALSFALAGARAERVQPMLAELSEITGLSLTTETEPASYSPLLSWDKDTQAVVYELEIYSDPELKHRIYQTREVYANYYNLPLRDFATPYLGKQPLYWRVRSIGFDGEPVSKWSKPAVLHTKAGEKEIDRPVIFVKYDQGNGTTLLYPTYSWAGLAHAAGYEVEIYDGRPATALTRPPVDTLTTEFTEIYDHAPRLGTYSWRVRAKDEAGRPMGEWSDFATYRTDPADHFEYAVLGDSISHGGGHYSFGPTDYEFSWLYYLDFNAVNLSSSGDTSAMTRARFARDVLPFAPKYLLIFTGTNSLRAGADPQAVIADLEDIKCQALAHGIRPILLTLPPINPGSIEHVFHEQTVSDWQTRFRTVNRYIRSQASIDIASVFPAGTLPVRLALDGLHEDVEGKKMIGAYVNAHIEQAKRDADAQLAAYARGQ